MHNVRVNEVLLSYNSVKGVARRAVPALQFISCTRTEVYLGRFLRGCTADFPHQESVCNTTTLEGTRFLSPVGSPVCQLDDVNQGESRHSSPISDHTWMKLAAYSPDKNGSSPAVSMFLPQRGSLQDGEQRIVSRPLITFRPAGLTGRC